MPQKPKTHLKHEKIENLSQKEMSIKKFKKKNQMEILEPK